MTGPSILITGATGFIGGWMSELLHAEGAGISAGVRQSSKTARLEQIGVRTVPCDIMNPASLDSAMAGVQTVVHCAFSHEDGDSILQGTRHVLDRAAAQGVRKLIYLSSVAVYGAALGMVTEDTPPLAPVNLYGERKRAAEAACQAAADPKLRVAVLRPSLVYGPFGEEWTARFIRQIVSGQLTQLGAAGEGKANLIHVADLVRFASHLMRMEIPDFSVHNVNGSEIPTFNDYFDRLSRALGRGPLRPAASGPSHRIKAAVRRPIRVAGKYVLQHQPALLSRLSRRSAGLEALIERAQATMRRLPSEDAMRLYGSDVVYCAERAKRIGFEARTSVDSGIDGSVAWARLAGLVG